jgi:hypothetical protein
MNAILTLTDRIGLTSPPEIIAYKVKNSIIVGCRKAGSKTRQHAGSWHARKTINDYVCWLYDNDGSAHVYHKNWRDVVDIYTQLTVYPDNLYNKAIAVPWLPMTEDDLLHVSGYSELE